MKGECSFHNDVCASYRRDTHLERAPYMHAEQLLTPFRMAERADARKKALKVVCQKTKDLHNRQTLSVFN